MRWYVTTKATVNLDQLGQAVAPLGGAVISTRPIPMGDDEVVYEVDGPENLGGRCSNAACITAAHPAGEPRVW